MFTVTCTASHRLVLINKGTHSGCSRVVTGRTLADGRVLGQVVMRGGQQQRQHRVASDVVHAEPVTTSSGSVADTQYLPEQNTIIRPLQFKVIGADERLFSLYLKF